MRRWTSSVVVLAGDVDLESCIGVAGAITPVPGGVALLTTAMLMLNTLKACILQNDLAAYYNSISDSPLIETNFSVCSHKTVQWRREYRQSAKSATLNGTNAIRDR